MLNNNGNHNHSSCAFAEQTVSYLYGEFGAKDNARFEAHLANCPTCADELTGFGLVRSSVIEWRKEEFSKLETPNFDIPTTKIENPIVLTDSHSWLAEIRRLFTFNPTMATAALAVLAVCVGLILFALNQSNESEVAEKIDNKNSVVAAVSPTVEKVDGQQGEKITDKTNPDNSVKQLAVAPKDSETDKKLTTRKTVVKVSNTAGNNNSNSDNSAQAQNSKDMNKDNKKSPVKKQAVPNLIDSDDDEDKSVRLADLFDELDTK